MDNQTRKIINPAGRGNIYDAYGKLLAGNSQIYAIVIDAKAIENLEEFLTRFESDLELSEDELNKINSFYNGAKKRRFLELKYISAEKFLSFQYNLSGYKSGQAKNLPILFIKKEFKRANCRIFCTPINL